MSTAKQLTLFEHTVTENECIWLEMAHLKTKQNNLRKGLFGRFDELQKELDEIKMQLIFLLQKDEK